MNKISNVLSDKLKENGVSSENASRLASSLDFLSYDQDESDLSERDMRDLSAAARALASVVIRHSEDAYEVYSEIEMSDPTRPLLHQNERIMKISDSTKKLPNVLKNFVLYAVPFLSYFSMLLLSMAALLLIVLGIGLMIFATVAGILLFIVGILYGVSQLGIFRAAGIYEIGFGIILGGAASLITVLLYNTVLRGIPFCFKKAVSTLRGVIHDFAECRRMLRRSSKLTDENH